MKSLHLFVVILISVILFTVTNCATVKQVPPAINAGTDGILFEIGEEDGGRSEFQQSGWKDIHEYEYTVGINSMTDGFPSHMYASSKVSLWDSTAVESLKIIFNLSRSIEKVTLRLVRAGAETTIVKLDTKGTYEVTADMLGCSEHSDFGSYDLNLGPLEKGIHNIELSVADDGKGNGRYGWDAIILIAQE